MKRSLFTLCILSICSLVFAQNEWIVTDSGFQIWTEDSLSRIFKKATYSWEGQTFGGIAHGKGIYSVKNKNGYLIEPHEVSAYYGVIGTDGIGLRKCDNFIIGILNKKGKKNGFTVSLIDNRIIIGHYKNGECEDSLSIYSHINDSTDILYYYGECECDSPDGLGTSFYQDGRMEYRGEWSNGMYDGLGSLFYQNGHLAYSGSFRKGMFRGKGTVYDRYGTELYDGKWKNGIAVNGQCMGQNELLIYDNMVSAVTSKVITDKEPLEHLSINYLPEKRIYLLDVTGSMEGRGNFPSPNIFSEVKSKLATTISEITNENTEIVIIPFTDHCFEPIIGTTNEKDSIIHAIDKLETKQGNTNIADAWNRCVSEIDSTRTNYLFLLTDGLHNSGPSKETLYKSLQNWGKTSAGNYYFAYYVMLTSNAIDEEIRHIADTTNQMWKIESMDVNASFINTSISIKRNINSKKTVRIDFTSNNENIFSQELPFTIMPEDNPFYSVNIDSHFEDKYILLEINELQDRMNVPIEVSLSLKVECDKDAYPLVFFTPDVIQLNVVNHGVRAMALTDKNGFSNGIRFDDIKFKEPFWGILNTKPKILSKSLSLIPFSWCIPDTMGFKKEMNLLVNDECIRSGSSITLNFVDRLHKAIPGTIIVNDVATNNGVISFSPKNNINHLTVKYKPEPYSKSFEFGDYQIIVNTNDVDILNGKDVPTNEFPLGFNTGSYYIVINWGLWALWILSISLIIIIVAFLVYGVIKYVIPALGRLFSTSKDLVFAKEYKNVIDDRLDHNLYTEANERINSDGSITYTSSNPECISCNPNCEVTVKGNDIYANTGGWAEKGKEGLNGYIQEMPEKHYTLDNGATQYYTDSQGNVKSAEMDYNISKNLPERNGQRDTATEREVVKNKDGYRGQDDGGHLFSREIGGPNESINQVPMERDFQQHGKWRKYERHEKSVCDDASANDHKVKITRELEYTKGCKRPETIKTKIIIDDVVVESHTFVNPKPSTSSIRQ